MDIRNIRVYNPKSEGITTKLFLELKTQLKRINPKTYESFYRRLRNNVLDSIIAKNLTLREFLFGENGYLRKNGARTVIFLDGKFHSEYKEENLPNLDKLAEETNSVPFGFSYNPELDNYLRRLDSKNK